MLLAAGCYSPPSAEAVSPASIAAWTRPVAAPHAPPRGEVWALDADAAIAYALANGPVAADRREQEAIADARIGAARQLQNPELHVGRTSEDLLSGDSERTYLAFRVHPDMPWALDARVAAAKASYRAEVDDTHATARTVAARVHSLYAQIAFGEAQRDLLAHSLEVLDARRRALGEQLAHAATTRLEVALAAEDAAELAAARGTIERALAEARADLAALLGLPPGQSWKAVYDLGALRQVRTGLDASALADRALANRPDLAAASERATAADATAYEERTKRVPWLDSVQVERSVRDDTEWAASATITLPIFSFNSGRIAAADATRDRYVAERRRLAASIARQLADAVAAVELTGRQAQALADALGPLDQELKEVFAQDSAAAAADPIKLLLLEERHVRAQRAVLEASYQHRRAQIALDALVGSR